MMEAVTAEPACKMFRDVSPTGMFKLRSNLGSHTFLTFLICCGQLSFTPFCTSFCLLQVKSEHHYSGSKRQQIMTVTSQNFSLLQPEGIIRESYFFALLYVLQTIRVNRSMQHFKICREESIQNIIKFYIFLPFFFSTTIGERGNNYG